MNKKKAMGLAVRPSLAKFVLFHRIAAGIEHLGVIRYIGANTLIDVGANKGQFSLAFRYARPQAQIVAFEPLAMAADQYERLFAADSLVSLHRAALSDETTTADFHITDRQDSSSLFTPGANQQEIFGVGLSSTINVKVHRLNDYLKDLTISRPVLLKIDVQGAEMKVLRGIDNLASIDAIYVELSFIELYDSQPLFDEIYRYLVDNGFRLLGLFNQTFDDKRGPVQADALFRRNNY